MTTEADAQESQRHHSLLRALVAQFQLSIRSPHGPAHWLRVRRNGLKLALHTGANPLVVELFALFHDSRREHEHDDPMHGPRAALLVERYHDLGLFQCTPEEREILKAACYGHTYEHDHPDPAIATCWDADRLDLPRVGLIPVPHRLCTATARQEDVIQRARVRAEAWLVRTYPME